MNRKEHTLGWQRLVAGALFAVCVAGAAAYYRAELAGRIVQMEHWIAGQGAWGPCVFAVLIAVLTAVFFPDSVLSAIAGAMFGVLLGTAVVLAGAMVAQSIAFFVSRRFLQSRVRQAIGQRPKLAAIQQAADREGFRLQFLMRLTPLNAALVSYVLGTTRSRFGVFLLACLGMVPGLFVQVYCGYTAKHMLKVAGDVSQHSTLETVLVAVGLAACVLAFILVTRMAQRAIAQAEMLPD